MLFCRSVIQSAFMQKIRTSPKFILRDAHPPGMHANAHWRMDMNRAWLATSATALLAAAAFTLSATQAGARDDHRNGRTNNNGGAQHFRSAPAPTVKHFQSTPHVRSGPAPTARHFESAPRFRSTPRHVESVPHVRPGGQPQVHFNGRNPPQLHLNRGGERHVRRHHRFRAPVISFALPYVYEPGYYADDECYVWQPAMTPLGWRYIWMNICDDDY
jgi:hypothetical protein